MAVVWYESKNKKQVSKPTCFDWMLYDQLIVERAFVIS